MQALLDAIAAMPLPVEAQRVFHGRGGLHPGSEQWSLDAYPPVFVLTSFAPATDEDLAAIGAALQARWAQIAPAGGPLNRGFELDALEHRLNCNPLSFPRSFHLRSPSFFLCATPAQRL